ncbi:MAG TPA: NIPSNAP family protein [Gemmataceae bacterium]|nr:NIPSNAP family protein [Gemmataceae bacterium]
MKRRSFIQKSLTASVATAVGAVAIEAADPKGRELYELRVYSLPAAKQEILDRYLSRAFIPALKRLGIGPVGVFVEKAEKDQQKVYVLIVHPSADHVATLSARLAADKDYRKAANEYLSASAGDPVYTRIGSSLLAPIEGMPRLVKPDTAKPRLLNLRIYESHNERAAQKKIEMFNKSELAIFRRVGLTPVFFAETVVGAAMPNLTYLLVFPDDAGREAAWTRFRKDEEWQKLRAIPEYADKEIVSRITNKILTPTAYSEI